MDVSKVVVVVVAQPEVSNATTIPDNSKSRLKQKAGKGDMDTSVCRTGYAEPTFLAKQPPCRIKVRAPDRIVAVTARPLC